MEVMIVLIVAAAVMLILVLLFWARRRRLTNLAEPIIELEKLVNCRSCGSLIPEGARMCAFCGVVQKDEASADRRTN